MSQRNTSALFSVLQENSQTVFRQSDSHIFSGFYCMRAWVWWMWQIWYHMRWIRWMQYRMRHMSQMWYRMRYCITWQYYSPPHQYSTSTTCTARGPLPCVSNSTIQWILWPWFLGQGAGMVTTEWTPQPWGGRWWKVCRERACNNINVINAI